jgi:ABC-type glycerol-3-phosphate transport system substrate-binding protein
MTPARSLGSDSTGATPRFKRQTLLVGSLLGMVLSVLAGCSHEGLRASGTVTLATTFDAARESIRRVALGYPGLTLNLVSGTPGAPGAADSDSPSDMVLTEYSGNLYRAHASSSYSDLKRYASRMSSPARVYPGVVRFAEPNRDWFLPAAAYTWGLFSNKAVLARHKMQPPKDIDTLIADCETLKTQGITPIALSDSHGWPLLGWFLEIDLLRNGPDRYLDLFSGKRSFKDPETISSLAELDRWLSKGYFNANAASIVWTDALKMLEDGKAAFMLMGGFAVNNASDLPGLSFTLLNEKRGSRVPEAVLGSVSGFVFPASSANLESALALADRWITEGATGQTEDGFRVPAAAPSGASPTKAVTEVQAQTMTALEAGTRVVPLLDATLTDRAAYDLHAAFISWPPAGLGSPEAIANFAARVAAILETTR